MSTLALLAPLIKRQRIDRVRPFIRGDVLEIGCKDGATLDLGCPIGRYVGIDIDNDALVSAKARHPSREFVKKNVEVEPFGYVDAFDTILLIALVEHVLNQRILFEQCREALRMGGQLVLTTPTNFGNDIVHRWGARLGLFHKSVHDNHVVIYDRTRLQAAAAMTGFAVVIHRKFQFGCNQLALLQKVR
jgi:SAM-dependent methyltransferase